MTAWLEEDALVEIPVRLPLVEVERLTRIIDRARRAGLMMMPRQGVDNTPPDRLAMFARFILTMRRSRESALPLIEFGEPAWDMLLDLYVQHVEGHKVSVSSLCTAAAVPTTTALRWIDAMAGAGHFVRMPDPCDGRRVHVTLTPALLDAVETYLTDMRQRALAVLQ
jgi:DNA-binding MarR family transcriptional regulator